MHLSYYSEEEYEDEYTGEAPLKRCKDEDDPTTTTTAAVVAVDRISSLDDDILIHILSFLRTRDAVRTGILSKRWLYLWTLVPSLQFHSSDIAAASATSDHDHDLERDGFCNFVNNTLILHNSHRIQKFKLYVLFDCDDDIQDDFDTWFRFATLKNVQDLDVYTHVYDGAYNMYQVPLHVYACSSLRKMRWAYGVFDSGVMVNWGLLKDLTFKHCELSEEFVNSLLSNTPLLQCVRFYKCFRLPHLNITSPALEKLVINNNEPVDDGPALKINAPFLQSLSIVGVMSRDLELGNLSSLIHARLEFDMEKPSVGEGNGKEDKIMFRKMFERVCHVTQLTLGSWNMTCLPKLNSKSMSLPLLKCKRLTLKAEVMFDDFPRIANLLNSSRELEELVLELTSSFHTRYDKVADKRYWTSCEMTFTCLVSHLKTIQIIHHKIPSIIEEPQFTLLQFLLKEARVLEKIIIQKAKWHSRVLRDDDLLSKEHEFIEKVSILPKSSPRATVL